MDKEKPFQHQKQQKLKQTCNSGFRIVTDIRLNLLDIMEILIPSAFKQESGCGRSALDDHWKMDSPSLPST